MQAYRISYDGHPAFDESVEMWLDHMNRPFARRLDAVQKCHDLGTASLEYFEHLLLGYRFYPWLGGRERLCTDGLRVVGIECDHVYLRTSC